MTNEMHSWNEEQYPNAAQIAARTVDKACSEVPITLMDKIFEKIENAANNCCECVDYTYDNKYSKSQNEAILVVLRHLGYNVSNLGSSNKPTIVLYINWELEIAGR